VRGHAGSAVAADRGVARVHRAHAARPRRHTRARRVRRRGDPLSARADHLLRHDRLPPPRRRIVVFGAKARADGTPSKPLEDRIATAVELYKQGLAPRLLLSGGPGDGAVDEPETMRRYALAHGVPDSAIVRDSAGLNTEATVRNTLRVAHGRILAVSNFYHLPRIKLTFQRYGSEVYTVPSHTTMYALMPYQLAREDAAFWAYYARRFSER
jgi:vancomycin permeability regulator SanA